MPTADPYRIAGRMMRVCAIPNSTAIRAIALSA